MTRKSDTSDLLKRYALLPESYQPIWGMEAARDKARRACDDRVAAMLPSIEALPAGAVMRILDIGCAQGYFSFALKHRLAQVGRDAEVIGVDYLLDNIEFCKQVAKYHNSDVRFIYDQFDVDFFKRNDLGQFDVVLALNVLHHIRALKGEVAANGAMEAIRAHSRVLVCEIAQTREGLEWVGDAWHSSDDELLEGYPFCRKLAEFSTHLTEVKRPMYICSHSIAWLAGHWYPFSRALARSHSGVAASFAGQRCFLIGDDVIVKRYRGVGENGDFNRRELTAEEDVLHELDGEPDRYPPVLASEDDGEFLWMSRRILVGSLLLDHLKESEYDPDAVTFGLLWELAHLEERGFHHSDIRCWNVLLDKGKVRLIDFGAMTHEASPLHRVALAAVLAEVASGSMGSAEPFYRSLQPMGVYPISWRSLIRFLVASAQDKFTYAKALKIFQGRREKEQIAEDAACFYPSDDVLSALSLESCEAFMQQATHAEVAKHEIERARRYSDDLSKELQKTVASAADERAAADESLNAMRTYNESLRHDLGLAQQRAEVSERYAASLEAEREVARAAEAAHAEVRAYNESLLHELELIQQRAEVSERYAASLEAEREVARAAEAAHAEVQACNESLLHELELVQRRAEVSERYAASLEAERELAQVAANERENEIRKLEEEVLRLDSKICDLEVTTERIQADLHCSNESMIALRRRFRVLKLLWPRGAKD